jgi:pyruvate/2-oxoglutarate dehydrogenase complex dihydrolipoamide dehydrogenase (E3) component
LHRETERLGVAIHTSVEERIEPAGDRFGIVFRAGGSEQTIEVDRVVNGAGLVADLDGIDLAAGNIALGRGQISLDAHLRSTSNPAVFACGDAVATSPQLSPREWLSGRTYAETAAWAKVSIDKQTDRIVGAHILGHAGEGADPHFRAWYETRDRDWRCQGPDLRFPDLPGRHQIALVGRLFAD